MTLFRQLMITIVAIFSLMLVVVMGINFNTTKGYLIGQLVSTANDSATSLSMSVSDFMALEDYASVESSINAVFDSGYFSEVRVHVYGNDHNMVRTNSIQVEGVPNWFVEWIDFEIPVAKAIISNGWNELGQVYITGSAGYACHQIWLASRDLLISFFIIGFITLLLGSVALRRLFKPLAELEKQAEAIQQRRFIKAVNVPKTRELKSVVLSMNRMAEKLEKEFASEVETVQWLQAKAFKDTVSGLGNRRFFENRMRSHFSDRERGIDGLILVSLVDLAKLNNERGYESADMFIQSTADIVAEEVSLVSSFATVARLSGADFVALVPNVSCHQVQQLANDIMSKLVGLNTLGISYSDCVANIGSVVINGDIDRSDAMSQVDAVLREARCEGMNTCKVIELKQKETSAISRTMWKGILQDAIQSRSFGLKKQKVISLSETSTILHEEVFIDLEYGDKKYHAGYFINLIERFDLGSQTDQMVIEKIIDYIQSKQIEAPLTVNLLASSYAKQDFIEWLDEKLSGLGQDVKSKLMFEISEQGVLAEEQKANVLAQMLKKQKVLFGIDNVGKQFSVFQYLQTLVPDYVKIDSSYTRMAIGKESESFFIHTLCKMFNSLNIEVIATGIENQKQLTSLGRFDITGGQGFLIDQAKEM